MARVIGWGMAGFFVGVWARSFFVFGWPTIGFFGLLAGTMVLLAWFFRGGRHIHFLVLTACFIGIMAGSARFALSDVPLGDVTLRTSLGSDAVLEGVIIREPKESGKSQQILVSVSAISGAAIEKSRVLVFAERFPQFAYGDVVRVSGVLLEPEPFETDNGRTFDYRGYLAKDNIGYTMSFPDVEIMERGGGNVVLRTLFAGKRKFVDALFRTIPEPAASLVAGVTIGVDEGLPERIEDALRTTGVVHIVVLSGYNVTLVSETILQILRALPQIVSGSVAALGIFAFALVTGLSATVVRASLMAGIALLALHSRRRYNIARGLFAAAFFMVAINPKILAFDVSFQLSFLATLGLITFSAPIARYFHWIPKIPQEILAATLATQITVLPLLLFQTGALSLISPVANLLILPLVPMAMFAGFATGFLGIVSDWLALPAALISGGFGSAILTTASGLAQIPFASLPVPHIPGIVIFGVYMLSGMAVFWKQKRRSESISSERQLS